MGIIRVVQITNRVLRRNRNGSWNHIRGISVSFVQAGTIINGNGSKIQILDTTIILEGTIEAFINLPVVVISFLKFLFHTSLLNAMIE